MVKKEVGLQTLSQCGPNNVQFDALGKGSRGNTPGIPSSTFVTFVWWMLS